MKIGFDGKRAVQNYTGLGNYSRYVVEVLCRLYPEESYVLYAPKQRENKRLAGLTERFGQLSIAYPCQSLWKKLRSIWRIWGITPQLEKENIQLFHGLSNELPLNIHKSRIKSVVTIHDLIFLHYPQYYRFIDRLIYSYKFRKACAHADRIIAVSECTKRDIMQYFHTPESKIEVIYQGCDPVFQQAAGKERKEDVRKKYDLPERYILNVGSIEERKNAELAVKALPYLPQEIHLVLVGRRTAYTEQIERFVAASGLCERVHILSKVPFEDLPVIYQAAEIFTYPSYYEGFGIPIIEALHSGTPVVAATGSCLEEAGGPDSMYVHPDSVEEIVEAFNLLLSDPERCKRMVEKGKAFVQGFSDEQQAKELMSVYKKITG